MLDAPLQRFYQQINETASEGGALLEQLAGVSMHYIGALRIRAEGHWRGKSARAVGDPPHGNGPACDQIAQ